MKLRKLLGIKAAPKRKRVPVSEKALRTGLSVRNRYVLKKQLGEGGFGEVWLANDKLTGTHVALKFFHAVDNNSLDEIVKEYTLLGGMAHPNLLSAQHFDKWGSRPFIVMKYCSGGTASSLCGSISEQMLWKLIHDVASGLAYLQSLPDPIAHQDLKPSNIMIDENGNFMLSDFGISKKIESEIIKMSNRALGEGCIPYMGPERFFGDALPVMASDIWSLGASIYELATGELPFGIVGGALQNNGAEIPDLGESWSKDLNNLMQACMSKETWNRPRANEIVALAKSRLTEAGNIDSNNGIPVEKKPKPQAANINDDARKTVRISGATSSQSISNIIPCENRKALASCDFVDIGLSVKWSDRFWDASDQYGLGAVFSGGSYEIKSKVPCENLPTAIQIRELLEFCTWTPRKIGRTVVGYDVTGPNGRSIYIPFVEVQSKEQKVSKAQWQAMEKTIYFPAKEEIEKAGSPCKCKIDANGAALTTNSMIQNLHIRLVSF